MQDPLRCSGCNLSIERGRHLPACGRDPAGRAADIHRVFEIARAAISGIDHALHGRAEFPLRQVAAAIGDPELSDAVEARLARWAEDEERELIVSGWTREASGGWTHNSDSVGARRYAALLDQQRADLDRRSAAARRQRR